VLAHTLDGSSSSSSSSRCPVVATHTTLQHYPL
jgi:hypothetical protein